MTSEASAASAAALARPALFVTPGLEGPPTGGTLFDAHLLSALRAVGVPARRVSLAHARGATAAAHEDLWVDSLYLEAVPGLEKHAPGRVHLCLHYLPSLVEHGAAWAPAVLGEVERAALSAARSILVPSAWLGRMVDQTGALSGRAFVVEPGVDLRVTPSPPAATRGPLRAVMAANVVPGKGILPFLLALDRALCGAGGAGAPDFSSRSTRPSQERAGPEGRRPRRAEDAAAGGALTLTIIGSLDAAPAYAASCQEAALTHATLVRAVHFAGSQTPSATQAAIAGADVLLSASRMESYGMALAEARALGVPIVALRGGNAAAHVSGRAGGAVFDDDDALARELVFLAAGRGEITARRQRAWEHRRVRPWRDAARDFIQGAALSA